MGETCTEGAMVQMEDQIVHIRKAVRPVCFSAACFGLYELASSKSQLSIPSPFSFKPQFHVMIPQCVCIHEKCMVTVIPIRFPDLKVT